MAFGVGLFVVYHQGTRKMKVSLSSAISAEIILVDALSLEVSRICLRRSYSMSCANMHHTNQLYHPKDAFSWLTWSKQI